MISSFRKFQLKNNCTFVELSQINLYNKIYMSIPYYTLTFKKYNKLIWNHT